MAEEGSGSSGTPSFPVMNGPIGWKLSVPQEWVLLPSCPPQSGLGAHPSPLALPPGPNDTLSFALQLGARNQERESIIAENPF